MVVVGLMELRVEVGGDGVGWVYALPLIYQAW